MHVLLHRWSAARGLLGATGASEEALGLTAAAAGDAPQARLATDGAGGGSSSGSSRGNPAASFLALQGGAGSAAASPAAAACACCLHALRAIPACHRYIAQPNISGTAAGSAAAGQGPQRNASAHRDGAWTDVLPQAAPPPSLASLCAALAWPSVLQAHVAAHADDVESQARLPAPSASASASGSTMPQIDITSTLALMMGLLVPYSNVGKVDAHMWRVAHGGAAGSMMEQRQQEEEGHGCSGGGGRACCCGWLHSYVDALHSNAQQVGPHVCVLPVWAPRPACRAWKGHGCTYYMM